MKLRAAPTTSEHGSVLIVALFIGLSVGLALMAYLSLTTGHRTAVGRSQAWNAALPLVEAGIEEAMAHLNANMGNRQCCGWNSGSANAFRERSLGDGFYRVGLSTNKQPVITSRGYVRLAGTTNYLSRAVTVTCSNRIGGGILLKETLDLNGNGVVIDSFDSSDPGASTGGLYDVAKRKDNARIASEFGLTNQFNVGNADIWGSVATAPGGSVKCGPMGSIGDLAWHAGANTGIQPGAVTTDATISIAPVPPPPGGAVAPTWVTSGGNNHWRLDSGVYTLNRLDKQTIVYGNATLIVTDTTTLSDSSPLIINSNASVTVYCHANVLIRSTGVKNLTGRAANVRFYGMPACTAMDFRGGVVFIGQIYAPEAAVVSGGGGGASFNFAGTVTAKSMRLSGHINFHYDEALSDTASKRFYVTSWNEL